MHTYDILNRIFQVDTFSPEQEDIISHMIAGCNVLEIMPDGPDKSICTLVPAKTQTGHVIVVTPHMWWMWEQVQALYKADMHGIFIRNAMSKDKLSTTLQHAKYRKNEIIFIEPGKLIDPIFYDFAVNADISMIIVDHAQCVSTYDTNFLKSYTYIPQFIKSLKSKPKVSAFALTASTKVKNDIIELLSLHNPHSISVGLQQIERYIEVVPSDDQKKNLLTFLEHDVMERGIIYCANRNEVNTVYGILKEKGYSVVHSHGGLSPQICKANFTKFQSGRANILILISGSSQNFHKIDIDFIIHYNIPRSIDIYYKEIEIAGFNNNPTHCLLLYNSNDISKQEYLIKNSYTLYKNNNKTEIPTLIKEGLEGLKLIKDYCECYECLTEYLAKYFGETSPSFYPCDSCNLCDRHLCIIDSKINVFRKELMLNSQI